MVHCAVVACDLLFLGGGGGPVSVDKVSPPSLRWCGCGCCCLEGGVAGATFGLANKFPRALRCRRWRSRLRRRHLPHRRCCEVRGLSSCEGEGSMLPLGAAALASPLVAWPCQGWRALLRFLRRVDRRCSFCVLNPSWLELRDGGSCGFIKR